MLAPILVHGDAQESVLASNLTGDLEVHRCCTADHTTPRAPCSGAAVPLVLVARRWATHPGATRAVHGLPDLSNAWCNRRPCRCEDGNADRFGGGLVPHVAIFRAEERAGANLEVSDDALADGAD